MEMSKCYVCGEEYEHWQKSMGDFNFIMPKRSYKKQVRLEIFLVDHETGKTFDSICKDCLKDTLQHFIGTLRDPAIASTQL